ncbi:MAG: hypothetical protein PVF83_11155 [Anaerolineales bacterium]|jgi:lysophospholipid acyltransferase (LPLAT)-like uncharacterized protein
METNFRDRVSGKLLYALSRMVQMTCRYQVSGFENLETAFGSGRPVVITGWHGITMMLVPYAKQYQEVGSFVVIMPDDWRGASLQVFTAQLGAIPYPMNLHGDSTMGMGRKLVRLVREVVSGKHIFITPDGPDGPSFVIKPGLTFIAKKADAIILPCGGYARHAYVVPRWDRYVVPYPFSRVSLCFGEPFSISPDTEDLAEIDEQLVDKIHRVTMQAAANYYEKRG